LRSSAQAYSVFFTDSYVYNAPPAPAPAPSSSPSTSSPHSTPILNAVARRHIWRAHLEESTQVIAAESDVEPYSVSSDKLVQHAFSLLGNRGKVKPAEDYGCDECTQPLRTTTEPDSVVEGAMVDMQVVDGIVTGPLHCARPKCYNPLSNNRGESYCSQHVLELGQRCCMKDCDRVIVRGTEACDRHQAEWKHYVASSLHGTAAGVKRMIHRPAERQPWHKPHERPHNPHDGPDAEPPKAKHYFADSRYYCVETLCTPWIKLLHQGC
jgi:CxC6 like cysteine cluster associated with KDZ transposases